MSGSVNDLEIVAKIGRQLGLPRFKTTDSQRVVLFNVFEFGKVGNVYVGYIPYDDNLYVATVKKGYSEPIWGESTVFYNGNFVNEYLDEDNSEINETSDDLINFVKQAIKNYYSNLFD